MYLYIKMKTIISFSSSSNNQLFYLERILVNLYQLKVDLKTLIIDFILSYYKANT